MRRNSKKTAAPLILIMPSWVKRDDGEPVVTWALDHRTPTPEEIAAAVAAWKREQAATKPTDVIRDETAKLSHTKPGQGAGEEENEK